MEDSVYVPRTVPCNQLLSLMLIGLAVPPPASPLFDIWRHHHFLFILDTSQHPSTLWVECQDKVRLDSPRNVPCSRDSLGAQGALKDQNSIPSTPITLESQKVQVPRFLVVTDQRGQTWQHGSCCRDWEAGWLGKACTALSWIPPPEGSTPLLPP